MKTLFLTPLCWLWPFLLFGQQKQQRIVDSIAALKIDTSYKDNPLYKILGKVELQAFDYPTAAGHFLLEVKISRNIRDTSRWLYGLVNAGRAYDGMKLVDKALECYFQALEIATINNNQSFISSILGRIGNVYYAKINYPKALEIYNRALKVTDPSKPRTDQPEMERNKSLVKLAQNDKKNALLFTDPSFTEAESSRSGSAVYRTTNHLELDNRRFLEFNLKELRRLTFKEDWWGVAALYRNLGIAYLRVAMDTVWPLVVDSPGILTKRMAIDNAVKYNRQATLAHSQTAISEDIADNYKNLSDALLLQGEAEEALDAYKTYISLKEQLDRINSENNVRLSTFELNLEHKRYQDSVREITVQRQIAYEKERQLKALQYEYELKQAAATSERVRQQLMYEEELKRKQIEFDFVHQQEREVARQNQERERQRSQLQLLRQKAELVQSRLAQQELIARSRLRQQWLYSIAGFIALCLIGSFFFFRHRIRHLKLRNELAREKADMQLKEAEYKSRLNEITYSALRAQMNPHFIFNCLNSIKLYTEQSNTEAASHYLTRFSKLIRNTLDSGRSEKITLAKELESLRLYLELEAMRFKEKLQYTFEVDKNIDEDFIEVPPLLIQPYVENAIWHGVMHKEEGGMIRIGVTQSEDVQLIIVTIGDDGVGREKAAAINSKNALRHKSHGTHVTGERLALINEKYGTGAEAIIIDLFDEKQVPAGTLVTIKLPIR